TGAPPISIVPTERTRLSVFAFHAWSGYVGGATIADLLSVRWPASAPPATASTATATAMPDSRLSTGPAPTETRTPDDREGLAARQLELGGLVGAHDREMDPFTGSRTCAARRRDDVLALLRCSELEVADTAACHGRRRRTAAEYRLRLARRVHHCEAVGAVCALVRKRDVDGPPLRHAHRQAALRRRVERRRALSAGRRGDELQRHRVRLRAAVEPERRCPQDAGAGAGRPDRRREGLLQVALEREHLQLRSRAAVGRGRRAA